MPSLRGSKLTCFYCGCRSTQSKTAGLRKWQCTKCDAENWLDENGEITDPPAQASTAHTRYVQQLQRPTSSFDPISPTSDDTSNLFCPTCLKNQHLLTQSLAQFYPSTTDNSFSAYECAEAEYRESLEERYPQVCKRCEPRVRERLRKANYDAKVDHLGRVMRKLGGRRVVEEPSWRSWVVFLGGVMWWMSWMGEIAWHGLELLNDGEYEPIAPLMPTLKACSEMVMKSYEVSPACLAQMGDFPVYLMLGMGLLSIWWHPKLQEKVGKEHGRLRALPEYYKLQVLVTAARWAIWYWMPRTSHSDAPTQRAIHLFMALFSFVNLPSLCFDTKVMPQRTRTQTPIKRRSLKDRYSIVATDPSAKPALSQ
ncbi:MAG: hypothetical protein Q9164_007128 [Protoblastenia rupestris]